MYYFNKVDDIINWRTLKDGSWQFDHTENPIVTYNPNFTDPIIRWSQLLTVFRLSVSKPNEGEIGPNLKKPLKSNFDHRGLDIYRTNLKLIRETCRTIGAKLFVLKQATLITPGLPINERRRCRYDLHGFDHNAHVEAFQGIYQVIDEEFPKSSIIDTTALSGRPDYFFDHIHPNAIGAHEMAVVVSEALMNYIGAIGESQQEASADVKK